MSRQSSIPNKDVDFNVAQLNIVNTATTRMTDWDLDEVWMNNELLPRKADWDMAWAAYVEPTTRTPLITANKVEKRKRLEKPLRLLVKNLQSNTHVSDEDLRAMGIVVPSGSHTPAPVAVTYPDFDIDSSIIGCLILHFFDHGQKKSKAKPFGQHGAEIRWMVSEVPVIDAEELIHSSFDTHTPFTLKFGGHERGKTVYFALRWENTRGEKGFWSPVQNAIIP